MGLDNEKRIILEKMRKEVLERHKDSFMMHMIHYKLVISESKTVAACHNTSIRISEIFNVDEKCAIAL